MSIKHWEKLQLRDAATKVGSGATPTGGKEAYHTSGIPLIRSQNVRFEGFAEDGLVFLDASQAASLDNAVVWENDILLNITGASIGRVTLAPPHMDGARVNQHVTIVRLKEQIDPSFVRWFIASPSHQRKINSIQVGVTRQALTKDMVLRFELPLPPFGEQHRIVAKIEELFSDLDAGVAALKRAKANLKRYRAAVLKAAVEGKLTEEWRAKHPAKEPASALLARILKERREKWEADQLTKFAAAGKEPPKNWRDKYVEPSPPDTIGLSELPEGWCWASVEQVAANEDYSITDGPFGSNLKSEHYKETGPRVIRLQNIGDGDFNMVKAHISVDHFEKLKRYSVRAGDVVTAMLGDALPRACLVPEFFAPAIVKADCVKITVNRQLILPLYLVASLNAHPTRVRASHKIAGVGRPRLNLEKLRPLQIPLPPISEQIEIERAISEAFSQIESAQIQIEKSILRASRLHQSILKQAFEGKLVPQDPNDEPASVLLERLRASHLDHDTKNKEKNNARPAKRKKSERMVDK